MPRTPPAVQDPVLRGETGCENISVTHSVLTTPTLNRDNVVNCPVPSGTEDTPPQLNKRGVSVGKVLGQGLVASALLLLPCGLR